jgi:hypothetical protein
MCTRGMTTKARREMGPAGARFYTLLGRASARRRASANEKSPIRVVMPALTPLAEPDGRAVGYVTFLVLLGFRSRIEC